MFTKIKKITSYSTALTVFSLGILFSVSVLFSGNAAAAPIVGDEVIINKPVAANDPVLVECKKYVKDNIQAKACSDNSIRIVKKTATTVCAAEMEKNPDKADPNCITRKAKEYVKRAATEKVPKDAAAFTDALLKITEEAKAGVDPDTNAKLPPAGTNCENINSGCDLINKYLNPAINLLSGVFGLIVVMSLIIGGIQYAASGGDPQKVTLAKKRIMSTVVALIALFLFYGFLQFIVPGGLFKK